MHKLLQSQAMHLWVRPPGCGCLRAISRLLLPSSLHSICCLSSPFTLPINFPELQIHSETVQRGRELREETYTSKWTVLKYCEVHKGENTVANIKFPKWGQAEKNEETVNFQFCSEFMHKRLRLFSAVGLKDKVGMRKRGYSLRFVDFLLETLGKLLL